MSEKQSDKIVVYGLGTMAEYVVYAFENDTDSKVVAYTVDRDRLPDKSDSKDEKPIVPFDEISEKYPPSEYKLFVAVGDNVARKRLLNAGRELGYKFSSYICSKAIVWDNLEIGENVFISEDTGIQPFVKIGDGSIFFAARIGHHSTIGEFCLMSCCFLAGNITVGNNVFMGLTSAIQQGVTIANNTIIGMGACITKDTKEGEVYTTSKDTVKRSDNDSEIIRNSYLS